MRDKRSGKIVVVSHCILNVHSLEDGLALYPGLEEEVVKVLLNAGVGIFQLPCPEITAFGIFRKPMPKEPYDNPKVRKVYRELAYKVSEQVFWFKRKGYETVAVIGAEGSPTCGINLVGKWRDPLKKGRFPEDIVFVEGTGVFMEEFREALKERGVKPQWIGIPGKSVRSTNPHIFTKTLKRITGTLNG